METVLFQGKDYRDAIRRVRDALSAESDLQDEVKRALRLILAQHEEIKRVAGKQVEVVEAVNRLLPPPKHFTH